MDGGSQRRRTRTLPFMSSDGSLSVVCRIAAILDELSIPYALGGSVASSFFGEPRATSDVDVAIRVDMKLGERLVGRVGAEFYVPVESARAAIRSHQSFNLLAVDNAFKVDLFVLGDSLLDQRQLERRLLIAMPGAPNGLWVTSPEDQILRKLDWFRQGGSVSDRQWRDVIGILLVRGEDLDIDYLRDTASQLDLTRLLDTAFAEVGRSD